MEFWRGNLIEALRVAIEAQRKYEREVRHYDSDSALVAGWQQLLEGLKNQTVSTVYLKNDP